MKHMLEELYIGFGGVKCDFILFAFPGTIVGQSLRVILFVVIFNSKFSAARF